MDDDPFSEPGRTFFPCEIADGHDQVKIFILELSHIFGTACVDYADLCQGSQGFGVNKSDGPSTCTDSLPSISQPGVDDNLCHLGAAGISAAQEQDLIFQAPTRAFVRKVLISTSLGMRPLQTTFSLITKPGVDKML